MGIKRTIEPASLVVSVEEAKKQVEIASSVTYHNAHLETLIRAATRQVEQRADRALLTQTWLLTLDRFPDWEQQLPSAPLQSVTSITYVDDTGVEQTLASSKYKVGTHNHPGRITPAYNCVWPTTRYEIEAVKITYVAGFGDHASDVPEDYRLAILIAVDHWFDPDQPISSPNSMELPGATKSLVDSLHTGMKYGAYGVTK